MDSSTRPLDSVMPDWNINDELNTHRLPVRSQWEKDRGFSSKHN